MFTLSVVTGPCHHSFWLCIHAWFFAWTLLRVRAGRHCGRCGRVWRQRLWAHQTLRDAPVKDGLISHVTVTDRGHALCGQRLELVSLHSSRGRDFIVVALPNGRNRSLRRSQTDLVTTQPQTNMPVSGLLVDIQVLLTLMRHLHGRLSVPVEKEISNDQANRHKTSGATPASRRCSACMAILASGDKTATRPYLCEACEAKGRRGNSGRSHPC